MVLLSFLWILEIDDNSAAAQNNDTPMLHCKGFFTDGDDMLSPLLT